MHLPELTLWKILGLSEAPSPLVTFEALKLEVEPDKLPFGSQALGWHLTDENLFTYPGKMHRRACGQTHGKRLMLGTGMEHFQGLLKTKSLACLSLY